MDVTCPHCDESFSVPDESHYETVDCEKCGKIFEALTDDTQKISRDFLDEILGGKPPK